MDVDSGAGATDDAVVDEADSDEGRDSPTVRIVSCGSCTHTGILSNTSDWIANTRHLRLVSVETLHRHCPSSLSTSLSQAVVSLLIHYWMCAGAAAEANPTVAAEGQAKARRNNEKLKNERDALRKKVKRASDEKAPGSGLSAALRGRAFSGAT